MDVEYLLSFVTDTLARDVLITMKRDGIPPRSQRNEFMSPHAEWGWDAASDAIAWATLAKIANSEWDETLAYADEDYVETVAQELGDNAIEGVVVIDAETGDILLHLPGVVKADGSQYVGMQDTERDALLAEALSGRDLVFVHNHPNGNDASEEDLDSAFAAGAELLIVITPQGQEFVYIRGKYGMVKVRDEQASYEVGQENREETKKLRIRSEAQAWAFQVDSPELIFLQEESEFRKDLIEFGGMFVESTNLASLSDSDLLREIVNHETFTAFRTVASFLGGKDDYATNVERALYIRETADVTGFDPALLAMVQHWETDTISNDPSEHGTYEIVYRSSSQKSLGIGQIQIGVAIDMLNLYEDLFEDLNLPKDKMKYVSGGEELQDGWSNYDVGYQLYDNEEFNIRVAGVYLMHLQSEISELVESFGVTVSDAKTDKAAITNHDLRMLAVGAYNQGTGVLKDKLPGRYILDGPHDVAVGLQFTADIPYVHSVLSMADEASNQYALSYEGNLDEE